MGKLLDFIRNRQLRKRTIDTCNFVDFNAYVIEGQNGEEYFDVPMFIDRDGFKVSVNEPCMFLKCVTRFTDSAILSFAKNIEVFNRRFDRFAKDANFNENAIKELKRDCLEYIYERAFKLGYEVNDYNDKDVIVGGKNMKARGKFPYDKFDYFAIVDENNNLSVSEYPVFYSDNKSHPGYFVCPKSENFMGAVERLSNSGIMNIACNKKEFYEKYLALASYFEYIPEGVDFVFDQAWDIIKQREKEILECKNESFEK